MTHEQFFHCYIACLIGNLVHICVNWNSKRIDYKTANEPQPSLWGFIKIEKSAVIADLVSSLGLVYVADEWIDSAYVMEKIKTAFVIVGVTGSYLIMQVASVSKKRLREIVDKKTDIADKKV